MLTMNGASARPDCLISRTTSSRPRRQVVIMVNTTTPSTSGNQPPYSTLIRLALKNDRSITRNSKPTPITVSLFQPHW